jgi:hypothetical protein
VEAQFFSPPAGLCVADCDTLTRPNQCYIACKAQRMNRSARIGCYQGTLDLSMVVLPTTPRSAHSLEIVDASNSRKQKQEVLLRGSFRAVKGSPRRPSVMAISFRRSITNNSRPTDSKITDSSTSRAKEVDSGGKVQKVTKIESGLGY